MAMDDKSIRYYNELENMSKKERFGLFSQPPGLSIGDPMARGKSEQGPRGILTNPQLKSNVTPSLFQQPYMITINDPYMDKFKPK